MSQEYEHYLGLWFSCFLLEIFLGKSVSSCMDVCKHTTWCKCHAEVYAQAGFPAVFAM